MKTSSRSEQEIFAELAAVCVEPGYIHAIAFLSFRDNLITYAGSMKEADMEKMFAPTRLLRTEINTLLGLAVKTEIAWTLPPPQKLQEYVAVTERLLEELHHCLSGEAFVGWTKDALESGTFDPFGQGSVLREPIFYSGESAYSFQYLDLALRRYAPDAPWLLANRGFTIEQALQVAKAIDEAHSDRFIEVHERMRKLHPDEWTVAPLFAFTMEEVAAKTRLEPDIVDRVLSAFTLPPTARNVGFGTLQDFNAITATPLLRMPDGGFLLLQSYTLAEALYDAPFYWMISDKAYRPTLAKHRGDFTEYFVAERLGLVFGPDNVYLNVDIFETKASKVSDIDVLIVWGNRVVIVQAKSKRLSVEARKGNDQNIRDDFKKGIQAAYDQGVACSRCLLDKGYKFTTPDGREVTLPEDIKEVYIFCVVSDHYPALSTQARQFLKTASIDRLQAPLVMDVFTIDALTEMLPSPLQFLSYANRRANYVEQILASQELTILGYHLKQNLWVQSDVELMLLDDSFSAGLDIAMAVRRTGIEGAATPDGILTRFRSMTLGRVVAEIEARPESATIDLGFLLLSLSEDAMEEMSRTIDHLAARTRADGKGHDTTFGFSNEGRGITFYCTDEPMAIAGPRLMDYCARRKYREKAMEWFGLCMSSNGPNVRFGGSLSYAWIQDTTMDEATCDMRPSIPIDQGLAALLPARRREKKVGRNDPCPCGSGYKYKKCCLT